MTNGHTRNPQEIEADLDGNRARLSDTLEALQRRLSLEDLFNQTLDYIRSSTGGEFA